jgi:hypothetical protein
LGSGPHHSFLSTSSARCESVWLCVCMCVCVCVLPPHPSVPPRSSGSKSSLQWCAQRAGEWRHSARTDGRTCGRRRHRRKGEARALVLQKLHCEPLASISSTTRERAFFNENLVFSEMFYLQQNRSSLQKKKKKKKKTCHSVVRFGVYMVLEDSFHNLGFYIVCHEERALIFRTNILPHLHPEDEKNWVIFFPWNIWPSAWLHGMTTHTTRNKYDFVIQPLRRRNKCRHSKVFCIFPHVAGLTFISYNIRRLINK